MESNDVQQVVERELALLAHEVRKSRAWVDELLDPWFQEIGASGRHWTRAEMIDALTAGDEGPEERIPVVDITGTSIASDVVLLTYVSDPQRRAARRSSIWRRTSGQWRLLHHQGTLLH